MRLIDQYFIKIIYRITEISIKFRGNEKKEILLFKNYKDAIIDQFISYIIVEEDKCDIRSPGHILKPAAMHPTPKLARSRRKNR